MRAAVLHEYGRPPRAGDFEEPEAAEGQVVVDVAAAALHHLDLHKATGTFYLGPPPLPSVVGTDGAGTVDGRRVYFDFGGMLPVHGSMAERTVIGAEQLIDYDADISAALAAACGNTGLGAWLALDWRSDLHTGETVLVLGAAGSFGSVAVQAAKLLGAGTVIAGSRGAQQVRGADATVDLDADDLTEAIRDAAGGDVDLTIDTLWGEPALAAMGAASRHARHIQVGQLAGSEIALSAPAIRSISLDVRGFSIAHPPIELRQEGFRTLTEHIARGDIVIDIDTYALEDVEKAWRRQGEAGSHPKLVLCP